MVSINVEREAENYQKEVLIVMLIIVVVFNNIKSSHVDGDEEEMVFCVWTPSIRLQSFSINVKCAFLLMCVLLGGHPTETLPAEVQSGCFNTDIGPHLWATLFSATQ